MRECRRILLSRVWLGVEIVERSAANGRSVLTLGRLETVALAGFS